MNEFESLEQHIDSINLLVALLCVGETLVIVNRYGALFTLQIINIDNELIYFKNGLILRKHLYRVKDMHGFYIKNYKLIYYL